MTNDYLWDKRGSPDADIEELERLLGRFAATEATPPWFERAVAPPVGWMRSRPFLAAAAVLAVMCAGAVWRDPPAPGASWPIVRLAGRPVAGNAPIDESGRLAPGEWLETDTASRATLAVSTIGRLDVEPDTRVRLLETREGTHRVALARGTVHAFITSPPGQFVVETPASRAVDLGCIYTLHVAPDGSGTIEVTAGWVAFERGGRESFIPAGARCSMRPRLGPGLPYMDDAPPALVDAVRAFDDAATEAGDRRGAVARIIAAARPEDAFTVWHLLDRAPATEQNTVYDGLARLVPPPPQVTTAGIRGGDRTMRDAWWNALELGDADVWRTFKRRWP